MLREAFELRGAAQAGDLADLHAQFDLEVLLVERLLGFLGDLLVHCAQEGGQAFQHRHFGAQAAPDRTHFQADHAGTDQAQLLGRLADAQGTVVGEDVLFVERHAG